MDKTQLLELKPTELVDIIYKLIEERENLIKYLKGLLTENKTTDMFIVTGVQDLLERIKNNNYEK